MSRINLAAVVDHAMRVPTPLPPRPVAPIGPTLPSAALAEMGVCACVSGPPCDACLHVVLGAVLGHVDWNGGA